MYDALISFNPFSLTSLSLSPLFLALGVRMRSPEPTHNNDTTLRQNSDPPRRTLGRKQKQYHYPSFLIWRGRNIGVWSFRGAGVHPGQCPRSTGVCELSPHHGLAVFLCVNVLRELLRGRGMMLLFGGWRSSEGGGVNGGGFDSLSAFDLSSVVSSGGERSIEPLRSRFTLFFCSFCLSGTGHTFLQTSCSMCAPFTPDSPPYTANLCSGKAFVAGRKGEPWSRAWGCSASRFWRGFEVERWRKGPK